MKCAKIYLDFCCLFLGCLVIMYVKSYIAGTEFSMLNSFLPAIVIVLSSYGFISIIKDTFKALK